MQVPGKSAKMQCPNDKEDNRIKETEKKETKNENKEYKEKRRRKQYGIKKKVKGTAGIQKETEKGK